MITKLSQDHQISTFGERVREHPSVWEVCMTERLTRRQIIDLVTGKVGAIHVRQFLPPQSAELAVRSSDHMMMTLYSPEVVFPPVSKSGVALFDYYDDNEIRDDYWAAAAVAHAERRIFFEQSGDPLWRCTAALRRAWKGSVRIATVAGRDLFAGMRREFSGGAKFHFDDVNIEFPGVFDDDIIYQIGFNAYLEMPSEGGSLSVAQHPYHPRDERFRDGYGYLNEIADGDEVATIHPRQGDAVLFCTRNMHSVEPVTGVGRRITFSFFIGMTATGGLVLWS